MEKIYYIGLDVGSTTAKIALIDSDNRVIYSKYERTTLVSTNLCRNISMRF